MPKNMNTGQAAVIEPILTTQARGYQNSEFIGQEILPVADVPQRNSRVIRFGKEAFRKRNTRRAPGAETMRVEFGYASDPVSLHQESLEGLVADEINQEAQAVPGIDLGNEAVQMVQDIVQLGRECEIADLVRDPANYSAGHQEALSGTDKWNAPESDPQQVIDDASSVIRRKIGKKPNSLVIDEETCKAMRRLPKVKEQFKYTDSRSVTVDMLREYLGLKNLYVGEGIFLPENAPDDAEATDIWGNDAVLFYKPEGSNYRVPAFGYTYRLNGYPTVEAPYYERNRKSWVYPYTEEFRPYITGQDAGYLIRGVR